MESILRGIAVESEEKVGIRISALTHHVPEEAGTPSELVPSVRSMGCTYRAILRQLENQNWRSGEKSAWVIIGRHHG